MAVEPVVAVKEELARAAGGRPCCRRAEVSAMLRCAATVTPAGGQRIGLAVYLESAAAAQRLRAGLAEGFGVHAQLAVLAPGPAQRGHRWVVRVAAGGQSLARRVGLLDEAGVLIRGLPPQVVTGATCDAEAVWRGAVLAAGSLSDAGKPAALAITCPATEGSALALAIFGAARRLGVTPRIRQSRGVEQVLVRERDAVCGLLTRIGAPGTARAWYAHSARAAAGAAAVPRFAETNLTRAAVAARSAAAQLARALEILDGDVPAHLAAAARLRIDHPEHTLAELGARCDPPLSKDTIAGRIRRLLALADTRAAELGIPAATSATVEPPLS